MIYTNILEWIGNTPLVKLGRIREGQRADVLAKLESCNPHRERQGSDRPEHEQEAREECQRAQRAARCGVLEPC